MKKTLHHGIKKPIGGLLIKNDYFSSSGVMKNFQHMKLLRQ